jgi:acetyl esterase/lipase
MTDDDSETVAFVEDRAAPFPLRIFSPVDAGAEPLPALVFFHGGGWVAGDLETHDGLCRRLANASGCKVIAIGYRLAPEHLFPAAIEDGLAAVRWASQHAAELGIDPGRLAIGGDSAGGGIAAALCQILRNHGGPAIALQLLICPILDISREAPSRREFGEGYFIDREALARDIEDYAGEADRADPRLSPLRATDLSGLPPTILHTAEFDPFRDEGEAYAARLAEASVPVSARRHEGMIHYFYAMPRAIPRALDAATMMGAQMRGLLTRE